jgi:hypothetical protein
MNRTREFDSAFTPLISGIPPASVWADGTGLKAFKRKAARRIAALEPELSAAAVIAPFVIAVAAALPTFIAA